MPFPLAGGFASRYRERGYWTDKPADRDPRPPGQQRRPGDYRRQGSLTYRELQQRSDRLAAALLRRGVKSGDTALVQLGNVAEFYIVFFALLKIGVAPVNALFSHQRSELNTYAEQIKPALLIADRQHALFADDQFLNAFRDAHPFAAGCGAAQPARGAGAGRLAGRASDGFVAQPSAADRVAFFQLSGGSTGTPKLIPRTHNDYYWHSPQRGDLPFRRADPLSVRAAGGAQLPMSSPGVLGVFYGAGLVVFAADPDAGQCFRLIEQHQINVTALVPPAVTLWLQAIEEWGGNAQLASLNCCRWAAPSWARRWRRAFRTKSAANCSRCSAWRKGW